MTLGQCLHRYDRGLGIISFLVSESSECSGTESFQEVNLVELQLNISGSHLFFQPLPGICSVVPYLELDGMPALSDVNE